MNEGESGKISRLDLLRAGAVGVSGVTLLGALTGAGCAHERLVRDGDPPKTDAKLIRYREASRFKPGMHWLRGVCTDGNTIWVAGDMEVAQFTPDGQALQTHPLPSAAMAVACAPTVTLYAALDDTIVSLTDSQRWPSLGPRARIVSLVADDTHVWAADAGNRSVVRFDTRGQIVGRFGERTSDYPGLVVPSAFIGLALHPSGDVVVTNIGKHRVERHAPDGKLLEAIGEAGMEMDGFCGCCNPTHVSVLPNGDMITSEKGLPRVKVISPDGTLKCVVAGPEAFHAETLGLATAVFGEKILVLDPWEGAVRIYAPV